MKNCAIKTAYCVFKTYLRGVRMKLPILFSLILMGLLFATSSYGFESEMCAEVYPSDITECEELISNNKFEKIPVELCQFRISKGEMLYCYKAIANKSYKYDVILECASTHHYGIPGCLEATGNEMRP
jgi:hypothetical protein